MSSPAPVDSVLHAIGHTPLVRLTRLLAPGSAEVVVKLEYFNPTGSYKDRMAVAMIEGAETRGALRQGMRVVALEPSTSPFLTTGTAGAHRVEGTAAGFWPPHLSKDSYDEVRVIDEDAGRAMARRAARDDGLFAGTSTGLNLVAALDLAREPGPGKVVATVACDTGLKYLAGDLYR